MKIFPTSLGWCRKIIASYESLNKIAIGLALSLTATYCASSYAKEPDSPAWKYIKIEEYEDGAVFLVKDSIQDVERSSRHKFFTIFSVFKENSSTDLKVVQFSYIADCDEGKLALFKTRAIYKSGEEKEFDGGDPNDPFKVPAETYEKKSLTYVCLSRE